jgi:hypothetical protein
MNFLDKCSILAGVATLDNAIFVTVMNDGLAEERQQHAIPLFFKNDVWSLIADEYVLPWVVAGMAISDEQSPHVVIVGWGGQVLVVNGDTCRREAIQRIDSGYVSIVRAVAAIDNDIYSVGMRRQVHKRTRKRGWEEIDNGVVYQGDKITIGFNTIHGFDSTEVYAAGLNGEIWSYNGRKWHEIQTPTNALLQSMCCASDGNVYIGGKAGVLIRGRHDLWEVLDINFEDTIWDIHCFKDKLFLLTSNGVYTYNDEVFEKIQNNFLDYEDFQCISSSKDRLWIFGRKKIVEYDGLLWREHGTVLSDDISRIQVVGFFNDDVLVSGSDYLED